jgi:hypothetical protein
VVATLQELDAIDLDQVHATVLLRDAPGPDICTQILQKFGFAHAIKGILQDGMHQFKNPFGCASVGFTESERARDKALSSRSAF